MQSNYIKMVMDVNLDNTLDVVRLLILVNTFTNKTKTVGIDGITKLAVFEFLLKYPYSLQRMVEFEQMQNNKIEKPKIVQFDAYEKESIEANMMALNFAPWSYKYRNEISILSAKNLISISTINKKVNIYITENGANVVNTLLKYQFCKDLENRSKIIKALFKCKSTTKLLDRIYQVFPEILESRIEWDVTYED